MLSRMVFRNCVIPFKQLYVEHLLLLFILLVALLGKEMATHSSILAWEIAWPEEPGELQFMGSQRVRPEKDWQPTPGFLPRDSCGQRGLVSCCPWGRTESDMTEAT